MEYLDGAVLTSKEDGSAWVVTGSGEGSVSLARVDNSEISVTFQETAVPNYFDVA